MAGAGHFTLIVSIFLLRSSFFRPGSEGRKREERGRRNLIEGHLTGCEHLPSQLLVLPPRVRRTEEGRERTEEFD